MHLRVTGATSAMKATSAMNVGAPRAARRAPQILCLALLLVLAATAAQANALDRLREEADAGDIRAQFDLAVRYATGRSGAPFSQRLAGVYYEKAARGGDDRAMLNLGMMYEAGRGVPKDDLESIRWTLAAAEAGNTRAQFQMALRFEIGHGVEPNLVIANMWLVLSASAGSPAAGFRLPSLENRLEKEQIRVSRKMARKWAKRRREARVRARERANDDVQS
jgi:TPR repeat protein